MTPFRTLAACACPLPMANIDTDQLIPARFMSRTRKEGYGDVLLHDLRFAPDGAKQVAFPLNDPTRKGAQILVTGRNFGSGSSREAAVYALHDFGIRAVIAPSFGDIFAQNAVNNGLLPAKVSEAEAESLLDWLSAGGPDIRIDLDACTVKAGGSQFGFTIAPIWRTKLLNGWDDLDLTLSRQAEISAFMTRDAMDRPWVVPGAV